MQAFVYGRPLPETGPLLAGGEEQGGELYRTGETRRNCKLEQDYFKYVLLVLYIIAQKG